MVTEILSDKVQERAVTVYQDIRAGYGKRTENHPFSWATHASEAQILAENALSLTVTEILSDKTKSDYKAIFGQKDHEGAETRPNEIQMKCSTWQYEQKELLFIEIRQVVF